MLQARKQNQGITLVELLVVIAILGLIFGGLFGSFQLMFKVVANSKAEAGALALANERLEYIRLFDYYDLGTVGGIPAGTVPQYSTTTLNDVTYNERVLIQYVDDPDDGFGALDSNTITADYKRVKVEYTWQVAGDSKTLSLISNIVPPGIETLDGGGTLTINVFDADIAAVEDAVVHLYNDTGTSTIDITTNTGATGVANFPGAPALAGYQITVTKPGYSSAQTYSASSSNPNPDPAHVAVVEYQVTTMNFQIDELSDFTIETIGEPTLSTVSDTFLSDALIASSSGVSVGGGEMVLAGSIGSYATTGTAYASGTAPSTIDSWRSFDFNGTTTASSSFTVRLYSAVGSGTSTVYTLVPDIDLPGNSTGFTGGPVNITSVDPTTYPALSLGATIQSSNSNETARLFDWELTHIEDEPPISGVTFTIVGNKTIGVTAGSQPIYKFSDTGTTDGSGEALFSAIEFDLYDVVIDGGTEGYDIKETYGVIPYDLDAGISDTLTMVLASHSAHTLRVSVVDVDSNPIGGASVNLTDIGFDETLETSIYGQVFFDSGVASSSDYTLTVDAPGYDQSVDSNVTIGGNVERTVTVAVAGSGGGGTGTTTPPAPPSTYLAGYDTRIPLSIVGTTLFGDVSDFPVYVDLDDLPSGFFSSVQSDGDDIRVTLGDGLTEVAREVVAIDTGSGTGQMHFNAPSLLTSTTTVFYIYYGSSTASGYNDSDTFGRDNVWNNNYLAVYHLEESQAGSGNANLYQDATGNGYHGDDNVDATDKTGQLGLGQEFQNSFTDNIELPSALLNGRTDLTVSFWYRTDTNNYMSVLSGARNNTSGGANEYLLWFQDRNDVQFFSHGDPRVNFDITNINDNTYRHYTSVRDDTNNQTRFYINANEDNQSPASDSMSALSIASGGLFIGVDQDSIGGGFDQELDGELDELRISAGVRDHTWIENEYLNQATPASFYTVGGVETE